MLGEGSYGKVFLGYSKDPTKANKQKLEPNHCFKAEDPITEHSEFSILNMDRPTLQPSQNVSPS